MIGIAHDVSTAFDSALVHYQQAFELAEGSGYRITAASALNNIGLTYWNLNKFDEAIDYFNQAILRSEELENHIGIANALNNIGLIYAQQGRYADALKYHNEALVKFKSLDDGTYGISAAYANLGEVYSFMEQNDSSIYYLFLAIEIGKQEYLLGEYYKPSFYLAEILKSEGNYKEASDLFELAYEAHDSIYSAERDEKILEITEKYENEKTEKELLKSKTLATENALKVSNRNWYTQY